MFIQQFYLLILKYFVVKIYIWPKTHETLKTVIHSLIDQTILQFYHCNSCEFVRSHGVKLELPIYM
jgi:hypothetical protein